MQITKCPRCGVQNFVTQTSCAQCGSRLEEPQSKAISIFGRIRDSILKPGLKKSQREELRRLLRRALVDKRISDEELSTVDGLYHETNLSKSDFNEIRDQVFLEFVDRYSRSRRITAEEKQSVFEIARRLGFSTSALNDLMKNFRFFELLYALETLPIEQLPASRDSRVLLRNGEIDYFTASGNLLEERVIGRRMVGRSHGISIPTPIRGVRYRVGQSSGQMVSERGIVPVSDGQFTVTNKRLVFSGDKKSVNAEFAKILDIEFFTDGLRFSLATRQTPVTVHFDDPRCAEVVKCYLNRILYQ